MYPWLATVLASSVVAAVVTAGGQLLAIRLTRRERDVAAAREAEQVEERRAWDECRDLNRAVAHECGNLAVAARQVELSMKSGDQAGASRSVDAFIAETNELMKLVYDITLVGSAASARRAGDLYQHAARAGEWLPDAVTSGRLDGTEVGKFVLELTGRLGVLTRVAREHLRVEELSDYVEPARTSSGACT